MSYYTHEQALTFCLATAPLCPDVQRLIWKEVLREEIPNTPPPTPRKNDKSSKISLRHSKYFN